MISTGSSDNKFSCKTEFKSFIKDGKILLGLNQYDACSWPLVELWGFRKIVALCESAVFQGNEKLLVKQPGIFYNVFLQTLFRFYGLSATAVQGSMSVRWQNLTLA